ncbi:3-hydroxyisobutyrate dehydrogenase [Thalictrum thalictroides]|uniref:3-hydroxyisobutyrate dehydrogenase n=1 Tax=Thalictrum thalictroides TaxID=46969 RepID=A0A7J6VRP2_THATH|nr:3-hydroxyisobutyrate dehydrogenase [Thalictrum thalictroides]
MAFSGAKVLIRTLNNLKSIPSRRYSSDFHIPDHLERVGFIGVGNMGFHMANNLIKAGYQLTIHDKNLNATKHFSDNGIPTKETPFEVGETSDVIVTMLPTSSNVLEVYTGQYGLLHGGNLLRPWLLIDASTIDPQTSRRVSTTISECFLREKRGNRDKPVMLDAPVSGGVLGAEAGNLTFMVGGLEEAYMEAESLFLSMGKHTIYCGRSGNGTAAKICNNLAMAVSMLGVSEAFTLGQSLGITASTLTKIFNSSSARCWSSDSYNPVPGVMEGVPSSRNYEGGFSSKLMAKDLKLAAESAEEVGLKCPLTSQARKIYMDLCDKDCHLKDFSCVFRHYYSGMDER